MVRGYIFGHADLEKFKGGGNGRYDVVMQLMLKVTEWLMNVTFLV